MFSMEIGKKAQILLQEPYFEFFLWNMLRIMQKSRFANFVATAGGRFAPCLENAMDNQTTGTQQQKITPKSWKFTIQKTPFTFRHHFLFFRHVFPRAPWLHQQHPEKLKRPPGTLKGSGVLEDSYKILELPNFCHIKKGKYVVVEVSTGIWVWQLKQPLHIIIWIHMCVFNGQQFGHFSRTNWASWFWQTGGDWTSRPTSSGGALECTKIIPSWQKKP